MVICECGGELKIKKENERIMEVSCPQCRLEYKRGFFDKTFIKVNRFRGHTNIHLSIIFSDLWRVFKRKGVKFTVKFAPKKDWWFQWWTPTWHFGKGPYITIGFWRIRIYRGY